MRDFRAHVDEYYIQYKPQSVQDLMLKTKQSLEVAYFLHDGIQNRLGVNFPFYKDAEGEYGFDENVE